MRRSLSRLTQHSSNLNSVSRDRIFRGHQIMCYGKSLFLPCVESACEHLDLADATLLQLERHARTSEMVGRSAIEKNIEISGKQDMVPVWILLGSMRTAVGFPAVPSVLSS